MTRPDLANAIIDAVADQLKFKREDLVGHFRHARLTAARHLAMFLVRELTGLSWHKIGVLFGNRDHSSVMYGHQRMKREIERDRDAKKLAYQLGRRTLDKVNSK